MKKYETPALIKLAVSSTEDLSAFLTFDEFETPSNHVFSYLVTSAKNFTTNEEAVG